jgi:filamin
MSEIDVSQIKVSGPGLTGSKTGEKCILRLSGAPTNEIADGLSYSVDGPSKPDAMCSCEKDDEGNTFVECSFVALQAGEYKFTIRYRGRHIPGSPFKIKITGDTIPAAKLISKV